jgi:hypothetical protein
MTVDGSEIFMRRIYVNEFKDTAALKRACTLWEVARRGRPIFVPALVGGGKKLDCYVPIKCIEYYTDLRATVLVSDLSICSLRHIKTVKVVNFIYCYLEMH